MSDEQDLYSRAIRYRENLERKNADLRRVGQMLASNLEGWVKTGKWEHTPLSTLAAWKEITNAVPANKG